MIVDKLKNAPMYFGLGDKMKAAFEYLTQTDLKGMENGRYEISGEDVFVIIQDYKTKSILDGRWEAHRKYIDIQHIIEGMEKLGYLNIDEFSASMDYDTEKDIVFGDGKGEFLTAKTGDFIVFAPQDAHMPGIYVDKSEYVKKAVVKVRA